MRGLLDWIPVVRIRELRDKMGRGIKLDSERVA